MKYTIQVSGGMGEPSWVTTIEEPNDQSAVRSVMRLAERSAVIDVSQRVTLWRGDGPGAALAHSWDVVSNGRLVKRHELVAPRAVQR